MLKELIPIIRESSPRHPNKRVTGKKGIDAGRFRLTYIGVDLNGYPQFKTRQGAWDITVAVSEDGFALYYDKLDLGVYICPGCNPIYMYHIKKHIPNHETAEIKELSKTAFLSIYHAKTGKEFDYSLIDNISNYLDSKFRGYSKINDMDIGKFHLKYKETIKDGCKVFKVNNNGENTMLETKEDNTSILLFNKHGVGLSISPNSVVYFAIINKNKKKLNKEKFNSIWYEKTRKKFDNSMVNELQKLLKKNNLNHLHDHYNKNENNLNSGSLSKIDEKPEYMQESN